MIRTWHLQDTRQSLVLAGHNERLPEIVYWGAVLPEGEDLAGLAVASVPDVTGGMLDRAPEVSICPEASESFPGEPGLIARDGAGQPLRPAFRFESETQTGRELRLTYRDAALGLRYSAQFTLDPDTGLIAARAELESDEPITLHWLAAPVFPGPQLADEMLEVSGRWIGEFQIEPTPWRPGQRVRDNHTGRTGHEHFPGLILPARGATKTQGETRGFHYGWSGGHRMVAEELPDGRRQIQFGHASGSEPEPATGFETATLYAAFSEAGSNGCAVAFQRHLRKHAPWAKARPVHYNCWEAVYFKHDLAELKSIAERAAALGAERFVLDDGWFGKRDDDTSSLGDWAVDPRKYPDGLTPLVDHVQSLGMEFGLWFEPEMVNRDSDLARAHPDWLLGPDDQIEGRQQRVLDMANPAVRDHLFAAIDAVLSAYEIAYVKWDHNRVLPYPDAAQARGLYNLLDRLRAAHPDVEFESCASGGGRIDFGILERTGRVWLSDSNDALERLRIQHDAALFQPACVTGSHVGPRHCHTSGRVIDIRTRAWVAAQRHMGFEMDPRELTAEEAEVLTSVTRWWKDNRDWRMRADILRLDSADPAVIAELQLAEDGSRFVAFAGQAATSSQILPRPLRLTGLDPAARYRLRLITAEDLPRLSRGIPALKTGPVTLSGQALMGQGLTLPWTFPERIHVIEGERL
ncbi:alpha-galactosidase [Thioclava sp. IC9]|uniref:alpha-galactosidase n=1 Tax=Thioclava sp. IC9 TaxID=1973007 RepID=UPI000B541A39|nr:alpha-galactosidase [Thioclava sp. IC9]OWY04436.1 alpha-galactosidase [Thioclava sp. IC9]